MRVAVIGAGVVGLTTAVSLAGLGVEVWCLEKTGHPMGRRSSGATRIFRIAHKRPELVELAMQAEHGFRVWERAIGSGILKRDGCVISGSIIADWAAAMDEAGANYILLPGRSDSVHLPWRSPANEVLLDPAGGVIDVYAVKKYLVSRCQRLLVNEEVERLGVKTDSVEVATAEAVSSFDMVVIAAGEGNSRLAQQVGIEVPGELIHHARFSFPIELSLRWHSWIDEPAEGLSTYQHADGRGAWCVGGYVDPSLAAWELGRDFATAASRDVILHYVSEYLDIEPHAVGQLHCSLIPNLSSGIHIEQLDRVILIYGENLFKFAPLIGPMVANRCASIA